MARNLPVAFAAIIAGGVLADAAIKGAAIGDVIKGQAVSSNSTSAGSSGTSSPTGGAGVPLDSATWGRTDQGVDAVAPPGSPVRAIVAGTVTKIDPNWYAGQPAIYVESPGLPAGADGIYYAEQLIPGVKVGDQVQAHQQIATVAPHGTGLEIGFAKAGGTLAQATGGYTEGAVTAAGSAMRSFLKAAGAAL